MRLAVFAMLALGAVPAAGAPRNYALPEDTAVLAAGANRDIAEQNCSACHSADYISTQPRGLANPRAFWQAEVTKMKTAYGAPLEADDMAKIVDYLTQVYGQ